MTANIHWSIVLHSFAIAEKKQEKRKAKEAHEQHKQVVQERIINLFPGRFKAEKEVKEQRSQVDQEIMINKQEIFQ